MYTTLGSKVKAAAPEGVHQYERAREREQEKMREREDGCQKRQTDL